jgi:hypothetical protein
MPMWLSNSKKYAMDGFLEERARSGIVHEVVGYGSASRSKVKHVRARAEDV